jgi:hypothetical protein
MGAGGSAVCEDLTDAEGPEAEGAGSAGGVSVAAEESADPGSGSSRRPNEIHATA